MDDQAYHNVNYYAQDYSPPFNTQVFHRLNNPYPDSFFPYAVPENVNANDRAPTEGEAQLYPSSHYPYSPTHIDELMANGASSHTSSTGGPPELYPPMRDFQFHELSVPLGTSDYTHLDGYPFLPLDDFIFEAPRRSSPDSAPPLEYTTINDILLQMPEPSQRRIEESLLRENEPAPQEPGHQPIPKYNLNTGTPATSTFEQEQKSVEPSAPLPASTGLTERQSENEDGQIAEDFDVIQLLISLRDTANLDAAIAPAAGVKPDKPDTASIETPPLPVLRRKPGPKPKSQTKSNTSKSPTESAEPKGRTSNRIRLREQEESHQSIKAEKIVKRRKLAAAIPKAEPSRPPTPPLPSPELYPRRTYRRTQVRFSENDDTRVYDRDSAIVNQQSSSSSPLSLPVSPVHTSLAGPSDAAGVADTDAVPLCDYISRPQSPVRGRMTRAAAARLLQRDLKAVEEATRYLQRACKPPAIDRSDGVIPGLGLLGLTCQSNQRSENSDINGLSHAQRQIQRWCDVTEFWADTQHIDIPVSDLRQTPLLVDSYSPEMATSCSADVEMRTISINGV